MRTTTAMAAVVILAWCHQALADPNLIHIDFDDDCPAGVVNDEDLCPQPAQGLACRRRGQPVLWQASPGPGQPPQFTIQPKGANPFAGCSLTSTPGGVLDCRISDAATPGATYEYGIANTATGCSLDPHIFILQ